MGCIACTNLDPNSIVIQVFTEAEIRASIVFQISRLVASLLKATRLATGNAGWDTLVAGADKPYNVFQFRLGWSQARYSRMSPGCKCMFVLDGISVSVVLALRVTHATPEQVILW